MCQRACSSLPCTDLFCGDLRSLTLTPTPPIACFVLLRRTRIQSVPPSLLPRAVVSPSKQSVAGGIAPPHQWLPPTLVASSFQRFLPKCVAPTPSTGASRAYSRSARAFLRGVRCAHCLCMQSEPHLPDALWRKAAFGRLDKRLGGRRHARAASFAAFACRDELALIVCIFRCRLTVSANAAQSASTSICAERGSDIVAPGRLTPLIRFLALAQAPFTPLSHAPGCCAPRSYPRQSEEGLSPSPPQRCREITAFALRLHYRLLPAKHSQSKSTSSTKPLATLAMRCDAKSPHTAFQCAPRCPQRHSVWTANFGFVPPCTDLFCGDLRSLTLTPTPQLPASSCCAELAFNRCPPLYYRGR